LASGEDLRGLVTQYLAELAGDERGGQFNDLYQIFYRTFGRAPTKREELLMLELVHENALAGVVVFGNGVQGTQAGYPWIWVTQFGRHVLKEGRFLPYDPDGFLARIKKDLPELDAICLRYLREAVDGFARSLLLSSSVMLGVASEGLMLQLVEAFGRWREVDTAKFLDAIRGRTMFDVYKEFRKRLDPKLDLLPSELRKDIFTYIDGLFGLIRVIRNDAGHPTDTDIPKNVLHANIQAFPEYARRLLALRKFFVENPGK
jgi:hypothetical protein